MIQPLWETLRLFVFCCQLYTQHDVYGGGITVDSTEGWTKREGLERSIRLGSIMAGRRKLDSVEEASSVVLLARCLCLCLLLLYWPIKNTRLRVALIFADPNILYIRSVQQARRHRRQTIDIDTLCWILSTFIYSRRRWVLTLPAILALIEYIYIV